MENLYQPEFSPWQVLAGIWRHKGKALFTFIVVCSLTAAHLSLAKRVYESEAKIYVRVGRESVTLDPTATTGQVVSLQESREGEVNAIEQLLLARETAAKVVDQLGPDAIFGKPSGSSGSPIKQTIKDWLAKLDPINLNPLKVYDVRDKAITTLQKNLKVTAVRKTSIVTVSYSADDPAQARDIVDALVAQARSEHLRINRTKGSQEFFEHKEQQLRTDLERLEAELRDLKTNTGYAELATQRELLLQRIASMQTELLATQAEIGSAKAEVAARQVELAKIPELVTAEQTTGQPDTPENQMRTKLYDLEVLEQGLAAVQTDESPQLKSVREQIKQARAILGEEVPKMQTTKSLNRVRQESELALSARQAQLAALQAKEVALTNQLADARAELQSINQTEVQIAQLQRAIDLAAANHTKYSDYLEQARIDQELHNAKISSLNLLQPPSYSVTPVSPKPIQVLAGGFFLACCAAVGVAFFFEQRRLAKIARQPALEDRPLRVEPARSEPAVRAERPSIESVDAEDLPPAELAAPGVPR
jgi:uncharacterized protein involved in exopolysaccharide biosynthesis